MACANKLSPSWSDVKASEQRKGLINASKMVILSCSVIAVELVVDKQAMQQLTEHFKFSSRHADARLSFSLRSILRRSRPSGLDQRRMGAEDENIMLIRFYRKKFTLAFGALSEQLIPKTKSQILSFICNLIFLCVVCRCFTRKENFRPH